MKLLLMSFNRTILQRIFGRMLAQSNVFKVCIILLLLNFISINLSLAADSQSIDLSKIEDGQTTGDNYQYLQDFSLTLTITEVSQGEHWQEPIKGVTNRGFSPALSWMKFTLVNPSDNAKDIILEYVESTVERLDLYQRKKGSSEAFQQQSYIFEKPVTERSVAFYRPAFSIKLPAHQATEVYVRIFQGNDFPMHSFTAMRIWNEQSFYRASHIEIALLLTLIIVEILMGFAALLIFAVNRDRIFLYYSIFSFTVSTMFASFSGLLPYFLHSHSYQLWMVVFHIGLVQIAAMLFVRSFLNIKSYAPLIDKAVLLVIGISIIGIIINLLGYPYYSRFIVDYTAFSFVLILPIGLYAWKKSVPHALLFTSSWMVFLIGMLVAAFRLRGYIEDSYLAQWMIYFGGLLEAILLTTIMIIRLYDLRKDKTLAETAHRKILLTAANDLVSKVNQQTKQLKQAKEAAEKETRVDLLTGLLNRRAFIESAMQFISRARRTKTTCLHLAVLDIDHFKSINDSYGHAAGDEMLLAVAQVLKETIRDIDTVSRIGGEEFAVVMENQEAAGAVSLTERLRQAVKNLQIEIDNKKICVTVSIGVSLWSEDCTLDNFLQKADKALYKAKGMGRNQVVFGD